jgi:hypothetical protein
LPVTAALASGAGANATRHCRETILAETALSSTPVLAKISRSRSSPRSEMCVGGSGGTDRQVGVAPRGVEEAEGEALLSSLWASSPSGAGAPSAAAACSFFFPLAGLVTTGLSGVGGPDTRPRSEGFIWNWWIAL